MVVDHYSLDADWERYFNKDESVLVVLDDLANRAHCCDILIDQNLVDNFAIRYKNLVNQKCELCWGGLRNATARLYYVGSQISASNGSY